MFKFLNKFSKPKKLRTYLGGIGQWHVDQIGMSRYYMVNIDNTKQFTVLMSSSEKLDGTISELSEWCKENDCSYGWAQVFWRPQKEAWESTDSHISINQLFIVARDIETATLAKLIWCC